MQKLKCKTRFTNAHVHDAGVHTLPTAAAALIEIDINIKYTYNKYNIVSIGFSAVF